MDEGGAPDDKLVISIVPEGPLMIILCTVPPVAFDVGTCMDTSVLLCRVGLYL
jgi:hypothetical protein